MPATPLSAQLKVIGDKTFAIGTLPASTAIDVECIVARAIGEPLFRLLVGKDATDEDQMTAAGLAVAALARNINAKELRQLFDLVFSVVTVGDGATPASPINFDAVFTGAPRMPWELLVEALKVNFSDFFPANLSASLAAKVETLQRSS